MENAMNRPDEVLPGTTIPTTAPTGTTDETSPRPPTSSPGPLVNGKPTSLTLYDPAQVATFAPLEAMKDMLNDTFRNTFISHKILSHVQRLRSAEQFQEEIGTDAGTFTYILTGCDDATDIVGTASGHRYVQPVLMAQADEESAKRYQTFTRFEIPEWARDDDTWEVEVWELKTMGVALSAQRQGVAGMLVRATEDQVRARFHERAAMGAGAKRRRCVMLLSTLMELNGEFYERKGYVCSSQKTFPAGHLESESAFTVGHLSKVLEEI
nr:hypothetical protein CFP56_42234 [Quercus suber]